MLYDACIKTIRELMHIPVAPFSEQWLAQEIIKRFTRKKTVHSLRDEYGNLLLQYRPVGTRKPAFCFQAHMDHPGFIFTRMTGKNRGEATVYGSIPPKSRGAAVRFFPDPKSKGIPARITAVRKHQKRIVRVFLCMEEPIQSKTPGMLDMTPFRIRGNRITSRGHDDTLGTAVLVAILEQASSSRWRLPFDVLLTRAEEAGLVGAILSARSGSLPLPQDIITIEMPRETHDMKMGKGVVCRAGDALGTFNDTLVRYILYVAEQCRKSASGFRHQFRLAHGGRTEASIFGLYGHRTAAICLAVRNAHNMGLDKKPEPEIVDKRDLQAMLMLLQAIAQSPLDMDRARKKLRDRIVTSYANFFPLIRLKS